MILAIIYSKVPYMFHAKYQPNRHSSSGEEVVYIVRCPICFMQNISLIGTVVLEKKSFERFFTIYGHGGHLEFQKIIFSTKFCTINR